MIIKLFKRLLPVQILLAAISTINGIISGIYGSNFIGPDVMSVVGLYNPIYTCFLTISTILLGGTQVLCGKYLGRNEFDKTNDIFSIDIFIVMLLGISISLIMFIFASPISLLLGADQTTIIHLVPYLRGTAIGIIPLFMSQQLSAFLSLEQQNTRTTIGSCLYIIANIVLGYLFVAKFKMGAFGLSLASSIGLLLFTLYLAEYYLRGKSIMHFKLPTNKIKYIIDIFKTGYAGALSFAYQVIRGFGFNALILKYVGNSGLAALATYNTINALLWSIPAGIIAVGRVLLSVSYGEEDRHNLIETMKVTIFKYGVIDLIISIIIGFFASFIAGIYYQDQTSDVFEMTRMAIKIVPPSMILSIICVIFVNWGQIISKHSLVHLLSLLDGLLCTVLFAYIFLPIFNMNAIWYSYVFNGIITTLAIFIFVWLNNKKMPKNMSDLMMLDDDFGASALEIVNIELHDESEVNEVSKKIQEFCDNRGINKKTSYYASLAMEEMAGNIISHGFKKDNKKHSLEARVVHKNNSIILRIKDDCIPFNPQERKDMIDSEDILKNIGIRMIYKLIKDIDYQHIFGLNVLTMTIEE